MMGALAVADAWSPAAGGVQALAHTGHVLAWLAVWFGGSDTGRDGGIYLALLAGGFAVFGVAFWNATSPSRRGAWVAGWLAVQALLGAAVESNLLYLAAAELAFVLPRHRIGPWLGGLMAAYVVATVPILLLTQRAAATCNVPGVVPPTPLLVAMLDWAEELGFQAFACGVGLVLHSAWSSRRALAASHDALVAAQTELDDAVRLNEQQRIARRVDQAIGQHLGALNLHLELARRQIDEAALTAVETSHGLAQRLIAQVRASVADDEHRHPMDLCGALQTLCNAMPAPRLLLECDEGVNHAPPAIAHTLLRITQEALSNCVRHAGASLLHVKLRRGADGWALRIEDDGRGAPAGSTNGSGLRGMRERVQAHGGRFDAGTRADGGFGIDVWLPLQEATA